MSFEEDWKEERNKFLKWFIPTMVIFTVLFGYCLIVLVNSAESLVKSVDEKGLKSAFERVWEGKNNGTIAP